MPKARWTHFSRGKHEDRTLTKHLTVYSFREIEKRSIKKAEEAAEQSGETILKNTLPVTPKDTGELRRSGRAEVKESKRGNVVAEVSFGNNTVDYAYYVHENLPNPPATKNYTTQGTGPYFLINGVNKSKQKLDRIFNAKMSQAIKNRRSSRRGR